MQRIKSQLWLHYAQPAKIWEKEVLPVGNGSLGASIMGGISEETVTLNEKSLWTGGPSASRPNYRGGNVPESFPALQCVQKALREKRTENLPEMLEKLTGIEEGYGAYQRLGRLHVVFDGLQEKEVCQYQRYLDLEQAIAGVQIKTAKSEYIREYFASYPDQVIGIKFAASRKGALSFSIQMQGFPAGGCVKVTADSLSCIGAVKDNGLRYYQCLKVMQTDGKILAEEKELHIQNATEVTVVFSAATDYANQYPSYRSGIAPEDKVNAILKNAIQKGYMSLRETHVKDYQALFSRVSLHLQEEISEKCTDVLLQEYRQKVSMHLPQNAQDRYLEILYFQYGRYLLMASSREGALPANLQGIWNESNLPPWHCDYHTNINLQMNYWPAMVANLKETVLPLVDYVDRLREPGRVTAADYYGIVSDAQHPENGWVVHTQTTPFGWTCPGYVFTWGWCSAAAAWLDLNLWEYYLYTGDTQYMKAHIYPVLRESAKFYLQILYYDERQNRYVASPTYSPEHGPVTIGNTYEQSLIQAFLLAFAEAARVLKTDDDLRRQAEDTAAQMNPYQISTKTGMLKEWYEEDEEDFDRSAVEQAHRHTSHLLGLYPAHTMCDCPEEIQKAAKRSLKDRGDAGTGWGMVMKMCLWARLREGDWAWRLFRNLLTEKTYDNLFDVHPPFQIDGNLGAVAGVAEMLLQSHKDAIELLPAIPKAWDTGAYTGLCARGGFTIDLTWEKGEIKTLCIASSLAGNCRIRMQKPQQIVDSLGKRISWNYDKGVVEFSARKGKYYTVQIRRN